MTRATDTLLDECIENVGVYLGRELSSGSVRALHSAFAKAVDLGSEAEVADVSFPEGEQLVAAVSPAE